MEKLASLSNKLSTLEQKEYAIVRSLFEAFNEVDKSISDHYKEFEKPAKAFVDKNREISETLSANLLNFSSDWFVFKAGISDEDRFMYILAFENFCKAVYNFVRNYESPFADFKGFERLDSPPLKAYKHLGNNKLDILPSKSSFSFGY